MADKLTRARRSVASSRGIHDVPTTNRGLPHPTKGFTAGRAEKWVLTSALVTALIYLVRHLVEGDTSPAPSTNAARQFLGQGSPPSFGQWAIAYGVSFLGLSLLTVAAPEVAAGLAMFMLAVTFLESGGQLATDLQNLESGKAGPGTAPAAVTAANSLSGADEGNPAIGPLAPSPASVGAAAKKALGSTNDPLFGQQSPSASSVNAAASSQGLHYDPITGQEVPNG